LRTGNGERGTGNGERGTGNREQGTGNRERPKSAVIPSGAAQRRSRGIAVIPVEGRSPRSGRLRFLDCAPFGAPLGMTPAIPRLRGRSARASLGMTPAPSAVAVPRSRFPVPGSRFPVPGSLFPDLPHDRTASFPSIARSSSPSPASINASIRSAIAGRVMSGVPFAVSIMRRTSFRAIVSSKDGS
jgi:hypothetical protein